MSAWARRWWAGEAGAPGRALDLATLPAEAAFRAGVRLRNHAFDRGWLRAEAVSVPVISVGNLTVGGAGKTPFAAWIARRLAEWGRRPAVVLRGYGGDEAALHREWSPEIPVIASPQRAEGARVAAAAGCDAIVLDDGFQHRRLARELDLVLVATEGWTARPRLLPRGPWREGPGALARAGVVVVTRKSSTDARAAEVEAELRRLRPQADFARCALLPARLVPLHGGGGHPPESLRGLPVLAVAGLAEPEPFFAHLRAAGAQVEARAYADHHPYTPADGAEITRRAAGRAVVVTAKDAVKLRALLPPEVDARVLEQGVRVEAGGGALDAALRRALGEHGR